MVVARVLLIYVSLLAIGLVIGIHCASEARADEEIPLQVQLAADEADVDPIALLGATYTTGLEPWEYLYQTGELARPAPVIGTAISTTRDWPIGGALGARLYCIESIESRHGQAMYNQTPWHGEHAQGWLGWLPSTAARWGAIIGNRASEWAAAASMLSRGAGSQFFGVAAGRC